MVCCSIHWNFNQNSTKIKKSKFDCKLDFRGLKQPPNAANELTNHWFVHPYRYNCQRKHWNGRKRKLNFTCINSHNSSLTYASNQKIIEKLNFATNFDDIDVGMVLLEREPPMPAYNTKKSEIEWEQFGQITKILKNCILIVILDPKTTEWELSLVSLLGLLAKIMCSICSCQLNIWHGRHRLPPILNWFLNLGLDKEACFSRTTDCPGLTLPPGTVHFIIFEPFTPIINHARYEADKILVEIMGAIHIFIISSINAVLGIMFLR